MCRCCADFGLARDLEVKSRIETKTYGALCAACDVHVHIVEWLWRLCKCGAFWSGHAGTITHMPLEVLANGIISKVSCL